MRRSDSESSGTRAKGTSPSDAASGARRPHTAVPSVIVSDARPPAATATSWRRPVASSTSPETVDSTDNHIIGRAKLTSVARAEPW